MNQIDHTTDIEPEYTKPKVQLRDIKRTKYMCDFLLGKNNGTAFMKIIHVSVGENEYCGKH